jgi:hypothetical protein
MAFVLPSECKWLTARTSITGFQPYAGHIEGAPLMACIVALKRAGPLIKMLPRDWGSIATVAWSIGHS